LDAAQDGVIVAKHDLNAAKLDFEKAANEYKQAKLNRAKACEALQAPSDHAEEFTMSGGYPDSPDELDAPNASPQRSAADILVPSSEEDDVFLAAKLQQLVDGAPFIRDADVRIGEPARMIRLPNPSAHRRLAQRSHAGRRGMRKA